LKQDGALLTGRALVFCGIGATIVYGGIMAYQIEAPSDVPEIMWPMYFSCLQWAIAEPEIMARFKVDTGLSYSPPRCGLDAMIDEATDLKGTIIKAFVEWFNLNVWGPWE